jgi:hypothetical protein
MSAGDLEPSNRANYQTGCCTLALGNRGLLSDLVPYLVGRKRAESHWDRGANSANNQVIALYVRSVRPGAAGWSLLGILVRSSSGRIPEVMRFSDRANWLGCGSGDAHCAQNLASGAFSEAHLAQRFVSGVAHWLQSRKPATLSVPHFEQRIGLPKEANERLVLVARSRLQGHREPRPPGASRFG